MLKGNPTGKRRKRLLCDLHHRQKNCPYQLTEIYSAADDIPEMQDWSTTTRDPEFLEQGLTILVKTMQRAPDWPVTSVLRVLCLP